MYFTFFTYQTFVTYVTMVTDCSVYLCDFHREQAWERWVSATKNGVVQEKEVVLSMLRRIARADTEERYIEALGALKDSNLWGKTKRLQRWFSCQWESHHKVLWACNNNNAIHTCIHYYYSCYYYTTTTTTTATTTTGTH